MTMQHRLLYTLVRLHEGSGRFAVRAVRRFSDGVSDSREPLKQWRLPVSPFIKISCNLHCNVSIRPLDLHTSPGSDQALITLHGPSGTEPDRFQVHYDDQKKELKVEADPDLTEASVQLLTPVKTGVLCSNIPQYSS